MRSLILLFVLSAFGFSCNQESVQAKNPYAITVAQELNNDTILHGIQDNINRKFVNCMARRSAQPLTELVDQLEAGYRETDQNLFRYWQAYALYYTAIYYLQNDEEKMAEKTTDRAIDLLDKLSEKTAEDFALLAYLQSFSISFKAGVKAPFISARSSKNARIALEMAPDNPRAHYVLGNNDYYTPEQFGGGKEVVSYLEKALELSRQQPDNPYLPTWGAENAYEMLMRYYAREDQKDQLRKTIDRALTDFPDSYRLNELAGDLSN